MQGVSKFGPILIPHHPKPSLRYLLRSKLTQKHMVALGAELEI